jgi:ankyrin repeat protein
MRIRGRKFPAGIACSIFFLTLFFTALPNSLFVDLRSVEWCWGCPLSNYAIEHSIDGDSSGFLWDRLLFDVIFWVLYFILLGLGGNALLRKIGLSIRLGFCLTALSFLTAALYLHLYRPDILINAETGGFLSFLESSPNQVDTAMRFGDVGMLQALFTKHPELISSIDITGRTPLHKAAYYGETSIVRLLLADKADVEARDTFGDTPLFGASINGYTGAAELLIKNGANVNVRNDTWETPLIYAAESGNNTVLLFLLANNSNVNAQDRDGSSALDKAIALGRENTAQLLITSNADVNIRDNDGETPVFHAVKAGQTKIVELLLSNGADANAVNRHGKTPVQVASDYGYTNIVEILRRYGGMDNGRGKKH